MVNGHHEAVDPTQFIQVGGAALDIQESAEAALAATSQGI
jgi:hypothetical protein